MAKQRSSLRYLWSLIKPDRRFAALIIALLVLNNGFSLIEPYFFKLVVDRYLVHIGDGTLERAALVHGLTNLMLLWILVAFISRTAKNFQDYFSTNLADRAGIRAFDGGFSHVVALSMEYHATKKPGEMMRRIQKAREDITKLVKVMVDRILQNSLTLLFVLTYSFIKQWRIGLIIALAVPVFILATSLIARKIKELAQKINREQESLHGTAVQALDHIEVVKVFGTEGHERKNVNEDNWRSNAFLRRQTRIWRALTFVQGSLINLFRTGIVGYATYLAFNHVITPGDVIFFTFYAVTIFQPLYELSDVYTTYQDGIASTERLQEVLHQSPTVPETTDPYRPKQFAGRVEFDHVSFGYTGDRTILRDVSFTLEGGKKLAVCGASGSGKSTIVKLLLRFYDAAEGKILVDGVDIRKWDLGYLRSRFGVVFQDNVLFNDTVENNIRYGSFAASHQDVVEAAELANAREFIERLPDGYGTKVGERGIKLSGGERQRIAIARAVIRKPLVYVFDEATSSLDTASERVVQEAIDRVSAKAASITIAHRLSTIQNADEILVLRDGTVAERGTHAELLNRDGEYHRLYAAQKRTPESGNRVSIEPETASSTVTPSAAEA
jgi:ATP-binding cassette subfamily B protein